MTAANTGPCTKRIIIAGAGIGGLTAALALHAQSIDVTVLESAREIRPLGVGINVQPAAIGVLTRLGLGEELAATGIATREHRYLDHVGNVLWAEPRGLAGGAEYPQYSVHRGELQTLLLAAVRDRLGPRAVRTGTALESIEQTPTGILVHADDRHSDTAVTLDADALVGADGLHSTVRRHLNPDQPPVRPAGVHMWRGVTHRDGFLDGRTMILVHDERATRLIAYPISTGYGENRRTLLNWVCLVPTSDTSDWTYVDWTEPGRIEDVLPHYAHWDIDWLDIPDMVASSEQILQYPMVDRDALDHWGHGRVSLLGDAAHLMYPIGANGASQAILDAARLARELADHGAVVSGLQSYETVRRPATTAILDATRSMDRAERSAATCAEQGKSTALADITHSYAETVNARNAASVVTG